MKKHRFFVILETIGLVLILLATLGFCVDAMHITHNGVTPPYARWEIFTQSTNFLGTLNIAFFGIIILCASKLFENLLRIFSS